jgi:hypothetical protein
MSDLTIQTRPKKSKTALRRKKRKKTKKDTTWSTTKADKLFSAQIRARDGKCVRCGKTDHLQCSHFWPRAISATRYDPANCDTLCYGCHYGDRYHGWEYAKQGEYRTFKINQLGELQYKSLEDRANVSMKRQTAIKNYMNYIYVPSPK